MFSKGNPCSKHYHCPKGTVCKYYKGKMFGRCLKSKKQEYLQIENKSYFYLTHRKLKLYFCQFYLFLELFTLERSRVDCVNYTTPTYYSSGNVENCANFIKSRNDVCSLNFFYNPTFKSCNCEKKSDKCKIDDVYEPPFYNQYRLSPGMVLFVFLWNSNWCIWPLL